MPATVRVAAAQVAPVMLDRDATIDKVCDVIKEAARAGAELVAFPESVVPGYPYWAMLLEPVSINALNRRLFHNAVAVPSPASDRLCTACREAGVYSVVGVNEREGGTLFNSQLFIGPTGELLGRRRKLMPTSHERMIWGRGDGADLALFHTPIGRLGGLICYEHSNPLYRYAIQAQGEEIHVACWPGGLPGINGIIDAATRHYAFEAQCFVLSVTAVLTEEAIAAMGEGGKLATLQPGGGHSAILGPRGDYLAGPEIGGETILYADLDFNRIVDMKMVVDSAGHYARPDVVELLMHGGRRRPLTIERGGRG